MVIVLSVIILYRTILIAPANYSLPGDLYTNSYFDDALRVSVRTLKEIPLWDYHQFSGIGFLSHPITRPFYISTPWVILAKTVDLGIRWDYLVHLIIAGLGTYYLLRVLKINHWGAVFGAIAYATSGGLFVNQLFTNSTFVIGYAWLPLWLGTLWKTIFDENWTTAVGCGLIMALIILGGNGTILVFLSLIAPFIIILRVIELLRQPKKLIRLIGLIGLIGLVAFVLSAVKLLPTIEFLTHYSDRAANTFERSEWAWAEPRLTAILKPQWDIASNVFFVLFMGWLVPLLAIPGYFLFKNWRFQILSLLWLVLFAWLSFGRTAEPNLFAKLFTVWPGFSSFQYLARFQGIILVLLIIWAAGFVGWLAETKLFKRQQWLIIIPIGLIAVLLSENFLFINHNFKLVSRTSERTDLTSDSRQSKFLAAQLSAPPKIFFEQNQVKTEIAVKNVGDTIWADNVSAQIQLEDQSQTEKITHPTKPNEIAVFRLAVARKSQAPQTLFFELTAQHGTEHEAFGKAIKLADLSFDNRGLTVLNLAKPGTLAANLPPWIADALEYGSWNQRVLIYPYQTAPLFNNHDLLTYDFQNANGINSAQLKNYFTEISAGSAVGQLYAGGEEIFKERWQKMLGAYNVKYLVTPETSGLVKATSQVPIYWGTMNLYENKFFLPRIQSPQVTYLLIAPDTDSDQLYRKSQAITALPAFDYQKIALFAITPAQYRNLKTPDRQKFASIIIERTTGPQPATGNLPILSINYNEKLEKFDLKREGGIPQERKILVLDNEATTALSQQFGAISDHSSAIPFTMTNYHNNQVIFKATTDRPNQPIILADVYYPGWRVKVDGRAMPVYPANGSLRGITIEKPGEHTVEFRFRPMSFLIGAIISAIGWLGLIGWLWFSRSRALRDKLPLIRPRRA